jgi:hypothetical protein
MGDLGSIPDLLDGVAGNSFWVERDSKTLSSQAITSPKTLGGSKVVTCPFETAVECGRGYDYPSFPGHRPRNRADEGAKKGACPFAV